MEETKEVEQLLRRVTGSVTEFVNEIGRRPICLDDFDAATLAIQDGDLLVFCEKAERIMERSGELLACAAGRPGSVGMHMTEFLLAQEPDIPDNLYLDACKNAIGIGDAGRVFLLVERAGKCSAGEDLSIYGDMVCHALREGKIHIALGVLERCGQQQVAAADPYFW